MQFLCFMFALQNFLQYNIFSLFLVWSLSFFFILVYISVTSLLDTLNGSCSFIFIFILQVDLDNISDSKWIKDEPLIKVSCLLNKRMDSFKDIYSFRLTIKLLLLLIFFPKHSQEYRKGARDSVNSARVNSANLDIIICSCIHCKNVQCHHFYLVYEHFWL